MYAFYQFSKLIHKSPKYQRQKIFAQRIFIIIFSITKFFVDASNDTQTNSTTAAIESNSNVNTTISYNVHATTNFDLFDYEKITIINATNSTPTTDNNNNNNTTTEMSKRKIDETTTREWNAHPWAMFKV